MLIDTEHAAISVRRQCELIGLPRSVHYYRPATERAENLELMRWLDEEYLKHPFYGSRRMTVVCNAAGRKGTRKGTRKVNRKRVQRQMRLMGIEGLTPKRSTSKPAPGHRVFPYLLRNVAITHPNHVWSTDITYVALRGGFVYLVALMDWYSRCVLTWRLSNRLEGSFCLEALDEALAKGRPEIFNTDQGSQFTSEAFVGRLLDRSVAVSMDGRGRALDNVFIERLWRSVKYEDLYLKDYGTVDEVYDGLEAYFAFYNRERPHQSLGNETPATVYAWSKAMRWKRWIDRAA